MDVSYMPSDEDVIYARERTIGIVERVFSMKGYQLNIVDVGGQRNERSKWIHAFDNVDAIIFVSALNHFNVVLFEDESINAMHESLNLFVEIVNGKWFSATELILFFNKSDLFAKDIRNGHSLSICFGEDAFGWKGPQFWTTEMKENYDFDAKNPKAKEPNSQYFQTCFERALAFVKNQYHQRNANESRAIYTHTTCAVDKNNIENVFWNVQEIVIKADLRKHNFL